MADKKCYMVILAKFTDRDRFMSTYAQVVPPLVERFGGRYVLMGQGVEVLEGAWGEDGDGGSMLISEWPDKEAVHAFWNSAEYKEAKKLRQGTGTFQVVVIEAPQING